MSASAGLLQSYCLVRYIIFSLIDADWLSIIMLEFYMMKITSIVYWTKETEKSCTILLNSILSDYLKKDEFNA